MSTIERKIDFLIVNSKTEYNPNVAYADSFAIDDNVICQKDEDDKKKRMAYESTFICFTSRRPNDFYRFKL